MSYFLDPIPNLLSLNVLTTTPFLSYLSIVWPQAVIGFFKNNNCYKFVSLITMAIWAHVPKL